MQRSGLPLVAVAQDESFACVLEPTQVAIARLPSLERIGEVGIEAGSQMCVLGDALLVLAPSGRLYVVDPATAHGPSEIASFPTPPGSVFLAGSGGYALLMTSMGIMSFSRADLAMTRFPLRIGEIELASAMKSGHFVVQVGGVLEEWSGPMGAPLRRFRIDRPFVAAHLGGSGRFLWFVTRDDPNHIMVIPLMSATPPVKIPLDEPASMIASDGPGVQLAVVGERTTALYVVSLVARTVTLLIAEGTTSVAWRGTHEVVRTTSTSTLELVPIHKSGERTSASTAAPARPEPPPPQTTSQQLAAWKKKVARAKDEPDEPPADAPVVTIDLLDRVIPHYQWRDALGSWARAVLRGMHREPPLLAACVLHDVAHRLALDPSLRDVLWLLYGARLAGEPGVAPLDLVEMCPGRWDDALGKSRMAASGAFEWRDDDRVHLAAEVKAALDELPPLFGREVTSGVISTRRVAVIGPDPEDEAGFRALAQRVAPRTGTLLVQNARALREPERYLREALVRGFAPIVPLAWSNRTPLPEPPAVFVVPDAATADRLGVELIDLARDNHATIPA